MAWTWSGPTPNEAYHPRLDPVSAFLFDRNSAFLRSGGSETQMLYAMGIDGDGFTPSEGAAWKALLVDNPVDMPGALGHPFNNDLLDVIIQARQGAVPDSRFFVLPLSADGPRQEEFLFGQSGLGAENTSPLQSPMPQPKAIIGIIDHGINIFHHRFRRGSTDSRVAFAWMQGAARRDTDALRFGREWSRTEIEAAQAEAGRDEDALLRQIGADFERPGFRPLGYRLSHGTHVLDLAAGADPNDPAAAEYPIVAVTLPPEVTRETSGSLLAIPFAKGLEYIADRARVLMRRHDVIVPVFVNFSVGLSGGPRGGQHRLERTIAQVAERHASELSDLTLGDPAPLTVVMAAGNNNLAAGHARAAEGSDKLSLQWQIQPADPSANFLELRVVRAEALPNEDLEVIVTPPGGDPVSVDPVVGAGRSLENVHILRQANVPMARLSAWRHQNGSIVLTLGVEATDPGASGRIAAPSGAWGVRLHCRTSAPDRIDASILRDDVPGGFRDTGRQSYFVDADYQKRDERGFVLAEDDAPAQAGIRRAGTLNAMATRAAVAPDPSVEEIVVVGGYVGSGPEPEGSEAPVDVAMIRAAPYSATPDADAGEAVDFSARSDCSTVLPGELAAGTKSGTRVAVSGTSVAAPQYVRHLAMGEGTLHPHSPASLRLGQASLSFEKDKRR